MFPYRVNTQNPNPILKIAICLKKASKLPKSFLFFGKIENIQKSQFLLCIMYKLHNSYFCNLGDFCILCIFVFCWGPHILTSLKKYMLFFDSNTQKMFEALAEAPPAAGSGSLRRWRIFWVYHCCTSPD